MEHSLPPLTRRTLMSWVSLYDTISCMLDLVDSLGIHHRILFRSSTQVPSSWHPLNFVCSLWIGSSSGHLAWFYMSCSTFPLENKSFCHKIFYVIANSSSYHQSSDRLYIVPANITRKPWKNDYNQEKYIKTRGKLILKQQQQS